MLHGATSVPVFWIFRALKPALNKGYITEVRLEGSTHVPSNPRTQEIDVTP